MSDGETGYDEDQITKPARDQHQSQKKRHVVDAGEDVHHPHADEFEKAGIFEAAARAARHVYRLVLVRNELLGEFSGRRVLHLREVGVARNQVKKGAGVDLQV